MSRLNASNSTEVNEGQNIEVFLQKIDEDGGQIELETDQSGEIKSLFISSKIMRDAFSSTNPPLIQVDTSFNVDKARYKIAAFCYLNLTTNKTEIAAIAYIADETASSLDFVFGNFSDLCNNSKDKMFIVDKDFTQIGSIKKHFPMSIILLCQFHTLKYMRTLMATALATVEQKTIYMINLKGYFILLLR